MAITEDGSDRTATTSALLRRLAAGFSGVLAVAARAEDTGEFVAVDADRVMPTASTIKLAILAAMFRQAHVGALSLDERIMFQETDRVAGSGVLKDLSPGLALTVRDYATLMIIASDNTATNVLVDRLGGVDTVNRHLRDELGLDRITLHRMVSFSRSSTTPLGEASPRHLMELAGLIGRRELINPQASEEMLAILGRQQHLEQAPRFLSHDPLAAELGRSQDAAVACKTGAVGSTRVDAGLFRLNKRIVSYAIMTDGAADTSLHVDHEGMLANASAGRVLIEHFWPGPGAPPVRPTPRQR